MIHQKYFIITYTRSILPYDTRGVLYHKLPLENFIRYIRSILSEVFYHLTPINFAFPTRVPFAFLLGKLQKFMRLSICLYS